MEMERVNRNQDPNKLVNFYPGSMVLGSRISEAYKAKKAIKFMTELLRYPAYQPAFDIISEAIIDIKTKTQEQEPISTDYFLWLAIDIMHCTTKLV